MEEYSVITKFVCYRGSRAIRQHGFLVFYKLRVRNMRARAIWAIWACQKKGPSLLSTVWTGCSPGIGTMDSWWSGSEPRAT